MPDLITRKFHESRTLCDALDRRAARALDRVDIFTFVRWRPGIARIVESKDSRARCRLSSHKILRDAEDVGRIEPSAHRYGYRMRAAKPAPHGCDEQLVKGTGVFAEVAEADFPTGVELEIAQQRHASRGHDQGVSRGQRVNVTEERPPLAVAREKLQDEISQHHIIRRRTHAWPGVQCLGL